MENDALVYKTAETQDGKILTNVCGYATIHGDSKYIFERIKKEFK